MKKKFLLFITVVSVGYITLTSYKTGAGFNGYECTGAESGSQTSTGCNQGSSCHSSTASANISVILELDSAGVAVSSYTPGKTYTVKITGTNNGSTTLPKFGFQVSCINGYSVAYTNVVNAGTLATNSIGGTRLISGSGINFSANVIEHSSAILVSSGGGGLHSTYVDSLRWTAPSSGTGAVSFFGALNAVDGTDATGDVNDLWNTAHIVVSERGATGIEQINAENIAINFANPVQNHTLYLDIKMAHDAALSGDLYNLNGQMVQHLYNQNLTSGNSQTAIHLSNELTAGEYFIHFQSGNEVLNKKVLVF